MNKFMKGKFHFSGGYLTYGDDNKFVSRFKYSGRDKAGFQSFLIKNFTVEEYFEELNKGEAPSKILETKGYISNTVKNILSMAGYDNTIEGRDKYISEQCVNRSITVEL